MASIYDKLTSGTSGTLLDRMVILDPREALIYPFSLGSDWTEIRLGFTISTTRSSGPNVVPVSETLAPDASKNFFYAGLVGWTGDLNFLYDLPRLTGSTLNGVNFLGVSSANRGSNASRINPTIDYSNIGGMRTIGGVGASPVFISDSGHSYFFTLAGSSPPDSNAFVITIPQNVGATGITGFASQNALRILINSSTNKYEIWCNSNTSVPNSPFLTSNGTVDSLRSRMASFDSTLSSAYNSVSTGFFTHNNTATGVPQVKPSGVLFYFPFFNNQIRLHAIAVERYA